jgi:hypothetical protein
MAFGAGSIQEGFATSIIAKTANAVKNGRSGQIDLEPEGLCRRSALVESPDEVPGALR